jgi:hypothetical protein
MCFPNINFLFLLQPFHFNHMAAAHGCNTWLQSLPERKKTAAKSQFGNTSGEISLSKSK